MNGSTTIAFLAPDGAGYITGQNMRVDEGLIRSFENGSHKRRELPASRLINQPEPASCTCDSCEGRGGQIGSKTLVLYHMDSEHGARAT